MSLVYICQLFGVSRQSYYQAQQRRQRDQTTRNRVIELVRQQRRLMPRLGTRKLHYLLKQKLQEQRIKLGRDGLFSCLRHAGLLVGAARSYRKTTDSSHWMRKYPNATNDLVVERPNQLWVADITYLEVAQGEAYLSLVTDAYSRKIVGYHVHEQLTAAAVRVAFEGALKANKLTQPLIHHSDRGSQYCADYYQRLHRQYGVTCSMTDGSDCYQNALAERMNGIIKYEFLVVRPADLTEARQMVAESVAIYNQHRPHLSLAYQTPDQVHKQQKAAPT
ncbi:hypothetical protein GCM10027578_15080 [Spirosoma luteolum]